MKIIEVTNLVKKFNNEVILDNLNFSVNKGEIVSIIGPSGQGKTTFLRCLAGLERIDSGNIKINGRFLVKSGIYSPSKEQLSILKSIGYVFQNFNLFNNLTIRQNIEIPLINQKNFSKAKIRTESDYLINKFKLNGRESFYPKDLSGGQKQRASIARALILKPEIILFDEPTSALDKDLTQEVAEIIKQLSAENHTIVLVTHQVEFANEVSDVILRLKNKSFNKV